MFVNTTILFLSSKKKRYNAAGLKKKRKNYELFSNDILKSNLLSKSYDKFVSRSMAELFIFLFKQMTRYYGIERILQYHKCDWIQAIRFICTYLTSK